MFNKIKQAFTAAGKLPDEAKEFRSRMEAAANKANTTLADAANKANATLADVAADVKGKTKTLVVLETVKTVFVGVIMVGVGVIAWRKAHK